MTDFGPDSLNALSPLEHGQPDPAREPSVEADSGGTDSQGIGIDSRRIDNEEMTSGEMAGDAAASGEFLSPVPRSAQAADDSDTEWTQTYRRPPGLRRREGTTPGSGRASSKAPPARSERRAGSGVRASAASATPAATPRGSGDSSAPPAEDSMGVVVVHQFGARWPAWLAVELAGETDALIVSQYDDECLEALCRRIERRLQLFSRRVSRALWLLPENEPCLEGIVSRTTPLWAGAPANFIRTGNGADGPLANARARRGQERRSEDETLQEIA